MELAEAPMDSEGVTTLDVSQTLVRTLACRRSRRECCFVPSTDLITPMGGSDDHWGHQGVAAV